MSKSKSHLRKHHKSPQRIRLVLVVLGVAIIGTVLLVIGHAATPYTASIASSGVLASGATAGTCAGVSSGSSCVTFNAPSTTAGCTYNGTVAPCIGSATTGASGWGSPTFDDEFNGSSLSSQWSSSWFNGSSQNDVTTSPSNVSVSNGDLVLTLSSTSVGASVDTNPTDAANPGFQIGDHAYVEARIDFPGSGSTIYNWPAFWVDGQSWPADGEIDVAEGLGQLTSNYHSNDGANNGPDEGSGWANSFHTYGVDRESGENYIYWDGKLIRSYATDDGGGPEYIVINVGCSGGCTYTTGTTSQVKVDYVRAWQ